MKKIIVTLLPSGEKAAVSPGTSLLSVLEDRGIVIPAPCGGRGVCGKCRVRASGGLSARSERELKLVPEDDMRLACSARVEGEAAVYAGEQEKVLDIGRLHTELRGPLLAAVDLGTTMVHVSLGTVEDGFSEVAAFLNPQRRFGHDVISRIAAASDPETWLSLIRLLRDEILAVLGLICRTNSISCDDIMHLSFSGNTTMTYALLGRDITPLGRSPYRTEFRDFDLLTGRDLGWSDMKAEVRLLPVCSAFLGGDLVGGLAYLDRLGFRQGAFFFDMGTNGEMFYRDSHDRIYAASCAMGPALEGMNIACGMTADTGAVDHVSLRNDTVHYTTIGNARPVGICGTGLIDIIALMLKNGALSPQGAFDRAYLSGEKTLDGVEFSPERGAVLSELVHVTQKDIRSVQLARGASLASAQMLLERAGATAGDVQNVVIAGSFGQHLDLDNFRALKFLPDFKSAHWHFLGNTSLKAAELYGHDREFREKAKKLRDRITVIELSEDPAFNDRFIEALDFK